MYDPATRITGKEALLEHYTGKAGLAAMVSSAVEKATFDRGELTIAVPRDFIVAMCEAVKEDGYTFLEDVTAVDWYPSEPRFQITYHILSMSLKARVRLIVRLPESDAVIDSIVGVWPSANFYEREVFDLFGVRFSGHPNLRRIMMPEDWQGHPLRKDYPVEGYR